MLSHGFFLPLLPTSYFSLPQHTQSKLQMPLCLWVLTPEPHPPHPKGPTLNAAYIPEELFKLFSFYKERLSEVSSEM